jgi:hypothetical protein
MQFFTLFIRHNQPMMAIAPQTITIGSPLPTQPAAVFSVTLLSPAFPERDANDTQRHLNRLEARLATPPAKPAKRLTRLWTRLEPQAPAQSHPKRSA